MNVLISAARGLLDVQDESYNGSSKQAPICHLHALHDAAPLHLATCLQLTLLAAVITS